MTKDEAIYLLRNTAWLAPSGTLELVEEAVEMATDALCNTFPTHECIGSTHERVELISREAAMDAFYDPRSGGTYKEFDDGSEWYMTANEIYKVIESLPSAEPTLRERALMLLLNWAVECDFGYDNFPEEYERYKDEIEDMSYFDGMIYIAEKEVERNEMD